MRWWKRPAREGAPRTWIDGILFFGEAWSAPQVALQASGRRSVCLLGTVGGSDADASGTLGFGLGTLTVTIERCFPCAWRLHAATWAERRAERLNAQRATRAAGSLLIYAYQLDPFSPMGRVTGMMWSERAIVVYAWSNSDWSREDARRAPWNGNGWTWYLDIERLVCGREARRARVVAEGTATIAMPEGNYDATYTIEEVEFSRPRGRTTRRWFGNVDVPAGVPFPGKGENDYDCGEDAAYGLSTGFDHRPSVAEICGALVTSVTASRGADWAPRAMP